MVERITCSRGFTVMIGPRKPASNRLRASTAPTERGRLLAPTSAIALGRNSASSLRTVMVYLGAGCWHAPCTAARLGAEVAVWTEYAASATLMSFGTT